MRHWMILCLGLAACGGSSGGGGGVDAPEMIDCSMVTGVDTFHVNPNLQHMGVNGKLNFQMTSADPAPPARDDNTWVIEIDSVASGVIGSPVDGLSLTATPFMPAHQHGTPVPVGITPAGMPGQYTLTPVNLWMPGVWETTVAVTSGGATDSAVFKFCIPN